jgi:hypothetical protein
MRALNAVSALPGSFKEALKSDWTVVKEESASSTDERQRSGVLLLGRKGVATRLRIAYTANTKAWEFKAPQAIEETLAA